MLFRTLFKFNRVSFRFIIVGVLVGSFQSALAEENWNESNPKHPSYKKPEVLQMIDKANYCEKNSDCGSAGPVGPYGCQIPVNIKEAESLKKKLEPHRTVLYSCLPRDLECVEQKCRVVEKRRKSKKSQ